MSQAATSVLFVVSVALCGGSAWNYLRLQRRFATWKRTQGTVVSITKELHSDDDGSRYMYAPVVRFRAGGEDATFQDAIWTGGPSHEVGARVPLRYDPDDPSQATLEGWRPYFVTLTCACMGVVCLLVSLLGK